MTGEVIMAFSRGNTARILAGTASVLAMSQMAAAQEESFSLDPIVVEAEDELGGSADRATSMYVTERELENARTGDLKDVFSGIASVSVGGALPLTQKIFVNGVDMLNLGVTIDGASQNNRAFHHVSANAIDPGLLKAVRVDATVSPADAGPYALAGSVVFETLDATDILEFGQVVGGNLRLSYSDNGDTAQGALTLAGMYRGFEWVLYGKRATGDDYDDGDGNEVFGTAADLTSFLGKLAYESDTGHRIEYSGLQLDDDELRQFRANFGGLEGVTDSLRRYDTQRSSHSLSYQNMQAGGFWDPRLEIGYSESDIRVPEPWDSNGLSDTWSASIQNVFHLSATDRVNAGMDFQKRTGEYTSPTFGDDNSEESFNTGIFAQARMEPVERLKLSFGGRYDWQSFEGVNGDDIDSNGASGNVSATYAITDTVDIRAGASSVFGGIDIEDNYTYLPTWEYDGLEASRANNATVGMDWRIGALSLGGEFFLTEINNARGGVDNFDFESKGFNLGATYGWATGFMRATLSRSDVEVDGDPVDSYYALDYGAPLGTVAAFEVQQETGVDGLRVGGGLDLAFDYDMPDGVNDLDGYEVVNVFAEYVPPQMESVLLRLTVDNLFDAEYADRATYGGEYDELTTLKEPGRTISLVAVKTF